MDGSILKLPRKLDSLLHHGCDLPKGATDEIPLIKGDLEKIIAITSDLESHHAMKARCWRKEVRELSYDLEDFVDQYEHAVQRIQRWGGRYSSPPYRRLVQEGAPKPTLQFCPWLKEWKIVSNKKERNKRMGEKKNKTQDRVVDEPLLSSSPASTCYRKIKSKAALPWLREKLRLRLWMANEIREFSVRVQEALQRHRSYNLDTIDGSSSIGCTDAYSAYGYSMCNEENAYVGISAALEKLEELLMAKHDHGHQKLKIVSIVGFGGIGKTTLATELYRKFGLQFECRAFVRTAQKPDVRRIFISMLSQVRPHEPPDNWTVQGLISTIKTHLQDKRYLIIVEDLSAISTWDIVKCALPDSNCCSRILTTTEIEDLALQCCGHDPKHVYKMKPLGEENSRELFFSSVFGPQHECPPELKEISYDIISKCGGLPLAIVTVASILSSQPATQDQWHYVNNSIGYNLLINHSLEGMKQVLDLSYNNLPHHLKACILYTCLYEEDIIIYRDDLVNQWIAEGFIQATEGQDKKEIARSFFDRLISGKLILPVDINRNGEVLSCTVHHMVLNLVTRYKSTEENFVTAIHHSQAPTTIADNIRRLSLQFGNASDAKAPVNVTLTHVRTLAIWGVFKCLPSVVQFPLLQVLILHFWGNKDSISFDITGISELFRLRYLKVTSNVILKLRTKMRSMQSLEILTIDARVSAVPSDIVHLPGLLHLSVPAETELPNGIGNLTSLRMLGYFDLSSNSMENVQSLRMLTNIEDLQLTCSTVEEPDNLREKMHFLLNSVFVTLRNLKSLTMVPRASSYAKSIDDAGAATTTISVGLPSAPALLGCLEVSPRICIFFCLPKWIGQLHKLCVLKFGVRKIDRDGVDILGGLPDLAVLSLYVHMKPEMGIVIGKTGFPVIKYFKFKCCDPCLKFEEGAMPNLRKLKLAFNACDAGEQNTIPVGINYLSELKEVSAKIGGAGPGESHTRAAKSAFRDAIRMHDRIQRVNIQCVKQIIFGNDDQSNITSVEDSPRSGEETTHIQNESKQRKEEEAGEAVNVRASSHGAMGLYELSDGGCGSNSEDNRWEVPRSSIRSAHFGSRSSRVLCALSKAQLQDGYVSYPWEKKMREALPIPNSSSFLSLLILPMALDRAGSRYNSVEDTLARANAWILSSQASGVPIAFLNVQTEALLTKISGETASSTVNSGSLADLPNLANASLYGFKDYHGVDISVVKAVRVWYTAAAGEMPVEIILEEGDARLGFAISRTEEGFIYVSSVVENDVEHQAPPSTRSGLRDLYREAKRASKLLVISRVSGQKVLPWMVSTSGAIRCFDTVSLSQKLSLHRHALRPILLHVVMWDGKSDAPTRPGHEPCPLQLPLPSPEFAELPPLPSPEFAELPPLPSPEFAELPPLPSPEFAELPRQNSFACVEQRMQTEGVGDPGVMHERDTAGDASFRFHNFSLPNNWVWV